MSTGLPKVKLEKSRGPRTDLKVHQPLRERDVMSGPGKQKLQPEKQEGDCRSCGTESVQGLRNREVLVTSVRAVSLAWGCGGGGEAPGQGLSCQQGGEQTKIM